MVVQGFNLKGMNLFNSFSNSARLSMIFQALINLPDMVTLFYPSRWSYLIPTFLSAYAETMCISRILPELKTWSWKSQPQVNYHPTNIADHTVEVHYHTLCHLSQPL